MLPFYEPGLEPLLRDGLRRGRLSFTTSYPPLSDRAWPESLDARLASLKVRS
jgi:UDP-glucose 6-dehydrogenase